MKKNRTEKASRAKYKCPPELEQLIYLTNLVPIGWITPDFDAEFRIEIQRLRDETCEPAPEISAFEFLTKITKHLPAEFLDYIKSNACACAYPFGEGKFSGADAIYQHGFVRQYIEYCSMRDSMLWLVQRLESERRLMREVEKKHQLKKGSINFQYFTLLNWESFPITIKTALVRDDNGRLQITGLAALIGKFDDSRLRRCEICKRVFWAKREGSETCSPVCFNTLRQRRHRERNKEKINEQRKANYAYKKRQNKGQGE